MAPLLAISPPRLAIRSLASSRPRLPSASVGRAGRRCHSTVVLQEFTGRPPVPTIEKLKVVVSSGSQLPMAARQLFTIASDAERRFGHVVPEVRRPAPQRGSRRSHRSARDWFVLVRCVPARIFPLIDAKAAFEGVGVDVLALCSSLVHYAAPSARITAPTRRAGGAGAYLEAVGTRFRADRPEAGSAWVIGECGADIPCPT